MIENMLRDGDTVFQRWARLPEKWVWRMAETTTTIKLIEQARCGDRLATERLLSEYAEPLRRHLRCGLPPRVKACISIEDVVQETLTRAFQKIEQLQGCSSREFAAWLFAIGNMILIDLVRKETTQGRGGQLIRQELTHDSTTGSMVEILKRLPVEEATASQIAATKEGLAALQVAIAGLACDQRRAIQLHLLKGMSLEETGDAMKRSPTAVRGLVHRAKKNLALAMGRASLWLSRR
jgi:RNA polymerase sigma-70 factor, ECF subfamily